MKGHGDYLIGVDAHFVKGLILLKNYFNFKNEYNQYSQPKYTDFVECM